jgi:hypothetical protein
VRLTHSTICVEALLARSSDERQSKGHWPGVSSHKLCPPELTEAPRGQVVDMADCPSVSSSISPALVPT